MIAAAAVAVLIAVALVVSTRFWGPRTPLPKVIVSTFLGIGAAIAAWMLVGTIWTIPDSAGNMLGLWMIVLTTSLLLIGRSGRSGSSRPT